jgi:RHS repeat-associated protein
LTPYLGATVLGDLSYEYDKAGNRTKVGGAFARSGIPQAVNTTSYNADNQQLTFGDKTLVYDNNGNLISITDGTGTTLYSWNSRNQMAGLSGPSTTASFVYDGFGRRQAKTINSALTGFLYDGVNPVQETSGASVLANTLSGLGIDQFFTRTDIGAGTTSTLISDALGSTIALADAAGNVQTEYTYEPFGTTTLTGTSSFNPFQYTGRENDETGLYHYRARYYQPGLQRFISEDPIEFRGGSFNLYAYVGNKPLTRKDPLGLADCSNAVECSQKAAECMAHAMRNEVGCSILVATGAATCYAGAALACLGAGPIGYAPCFVAFAAQCTAAAYLGQITCAAILTAETIQCSLDYKRCLNRNNYN